MQEVGHFSVGGQDPEELRTALREAGIRLNEYAELLLARPEMTTGEPMDVTLMACRIEELGLPDGGTLPQVYAAAAAHGLAPCPLPTAAHLRLQHHERPSSEPALRRGRPPEGALYVASPPLSQDPELPRGFYLRTVQGVRWLRGYRCDDEYVHPPESCQVFRLA
ncbi:hypothetical protein GCM10009599_25300 [Luteococcus peritonei]